MDPFTMQTSFSEVRSSMTLPRGATNRMAVRRFSAEPTTIPSVMFTSTASIQLSKASRVSRGGAAAFDGAGAAGGGGGSGGGGAGGGGGGGGGAMAAVAGSTASLGRVGVVRQSQQMTVSGEMFFDEDFSVPFDANLIVGTPLEEDSLQLNSRLNANEASNLRMVNSRSDGCLFYPELPDGAAGSQSCSAGGVGGPLSSLVSVQTTSGPSQNLTGVSVTSNSSDRLTGVSNLEDNCSWTESQGLHRSLLDRPMPYNLMYGTSGSAAGTSDLGGESPRSTRSRSVEKSATRQRPMRSTWAEVARRRPSSAGLTRWTSSQELSTHYEVSGGSSVAPYELSGASSGGQSEEPRRLTTWGRIHSASRERLNSPSMGSSGGGGSEESGTGSGALRPKTAVKTTWRQVRQQKHRQGPLEESGLLMARSRSMESLTKISRGVHTEQAWRSNDPRRATWYRPGQTDPTPSEDADADSSGSGGGLTASVEARSARYLRHQRTIGFSEFLARAKTFGGGGGGGGGPHVVDSRARVRRNASAAAALTSARESRRKQRTISGGSGTPSSAGTRASSQPPLAARSRQLMLGLSASNLPDLSFLSSHLSKLKERAAEEGERLRRTQSCQVLNTAGRNASPPVSNDSGFDSNEQSTLLCKRCGSLTNVDKEDGGKKSPRESHPQPALSQGLPSRHRSEPDLAQLYVHTTDIPIEQGGASNSHAAHAAAPAAGGRATPLKSCLVSRSKSPGGAVTPEPTVPGHAHRGSLDFTPGRAASPAAESRGVSPSSGNGGGELKKSVSFSRAVRVQAAAVREGGGDEGAGGGRSRPRMRREQSPPGDLKLIPNAVGLFGADSGEDAYPGLMPNSPDSPSDDVTNGSGSTVSMDVSQKRYKALVDDVVRSAGLAVQAYFPAPDAQSATVPAAKSSAVRANPLAILTPLTTLVTDGLVPPGGGVNSAADARLARARSRLWPMVEESCRQGVSHRVLTDVLREVKAMSGLTTDRVKFRAFLCACLNNKALSLWIDSLVRNDTLLRRYYLEDAFLRLASLTPTTAPPTAKGAAAASAPSSAAVAASAAVVRKMFHSELMGSLERLLTLPYRLDVAVEAKRSPASEWSGPGPKSASNTTTTAAAALKSPMKSPMKSASPALKSPSRQPVRARHDIGTGAATASRVNTTGTKITRGRSFTGTTRPSTATTSTTAATPRPTSASPSTTRNRMGPPRSHTTGSIASTLRTTPR